MSIHAIDPGGHTAVSWADAMVIELEQFGNLGRLDDPEQWREWAVQLFLLPSISGSIVPDPYNFATWDEWAKCLNGGLAAVM